MGMVMDMSSYEIERDSMESGYGEEVMYAGWNPVVPLVCQQQLASCSKQAAMSVDLVMMDAELFLKKMYAYQR